MTQHIEKLPDCVPIDDKIAQRVHDALAIAFQNGQTDGAHHKLWVIDQMVRALTGKKYKKFIKLYQGESIDDPIEGIIPEYDWETGTPP